MEDFKALAQQRIIWTFATGSRARDYGVTEADVAAGKATKASDYDLRSVFLMPSEVQALSMQRPADQYTFEGQDHIGYDILKFASQICKGSPEMLELLWDENPIISGERGLYEAIKAMRNEFVSESTVASLLGAAGKANVEDVLRYQESGVFDAAVFGTRSQLAMAMQLRESDPVQSNKHMVDSLRRLYQAVQARKTREIPLHMGYTFGTFLKELRLGGSSFSLALDYRNMLYNQFMKTDPLPESVGVHDKLQALLYRYLH